VRVGALVGLGAGIEIVLRRVGAMVTTGAPLGVNVGVAVLRALVGRKLGRADGL
jgi:hypothetical protein